MKKIISATIATIFCCSAFAQSAVVSLGNTATSHGQEITAVSQSAGQVAYSSSQSANTSVSEGVQQNRWSVSLLPSENIGEAEMSDIDIRIFPNPTTDALTVGITGFQDNGDLQYTIFSADGKTIASGSIDGSLTQIPMQRYSGGIYLLRIRDGKSERNYRIIKH